MKILLTGGSGFLGSALTRRLHAEGHEIALLLRPTSSLDRLMGLDLDIRRCTSDDDIAAFVRRTRPQALIHTACAYGRQGETLLQLADANVRLGLVLLQAMLALDTAACRLFLNTGTALPASVSSYALSKQQFSQWGRQQALTAPARLRFINVQLEHMYGPGDDPSKFTTHVLHACRRNSGELRLTSGEQQRDFVFIDDVVDGYATLLARSDDVDAVLDVPLGSGSAPSVREFVKTVARLTGSCTQLLFGAVPYRQGETMHCQADLTVMRKLGWSPHWTLEAGLQRTIDMEFPQS